MRITYQIQLQVIENLKENLRYELRQNNNASSEIIDDCNNMTIEEHIANIEDNIHHQIDSEVANACIYYSDCFDIVKELGVTDWEDLSKEYGTISDICSLAMFALSSEIYESGYESEIHDEILEHYEFLMNNGISKLDDIIALINHELKMNESLDYWGTEENIKNENEIFSFVLNWGIVSQDWFDERLKATNVETLKDLLTELKNK